MASRMITVMAPAAFSSSAVTGWPDWVKPTTIRPMRVRRSRSERASASTAITSDAAVMSKPVSRGTPSCWVPSPLTMWRSERSLTSRTRFQVMPCGSIASALPP